MTLGFNKSYELFKFGLVLWHINHCRLFNAKSIFIHTFLYIVYNGIGLVNTFCRRTHLNDQTVLFLTIQFSVVKVK